MSMRHYRYYMRKSREAWCKGMICAAGVMVFGALCYLSAFEGCGLWAVACACLAVFCYLGARVNFEDEKANRGKAKWY